jgi:hypothetical protein
MDDGLSIGIHTVGFHEPGEFNGLYDVDKLL